MDKARRLYPLAIKFSDGELPSAAKLTGISTQAKNALGIVEAMLGDIWNQAGDAILSPAGTPTINALHIPNLARSIGRLDLLNAMVPGTNLPLSSSMIYNDDVGTIYVGKNRGFLKYKPPSVPSSANIILSGTFAPLVQIQFNSDPLAMTGTGDWSVTSDGKLYTFDSIPSTLVLQYAPQVISDVSDLNASTPAWNVIPDPTTWTSNYAGVKISFANNTDSTLGYHIWLPPRKSLDSSKTIRQSPTTTSNISATPNSGSLLFFQDPTAVASTTNANHYRYNFPTEITSIGSSGDILPAGFLYIWDETTGTIIDGASFFVPGTIGDRKFKVRATGANLITVFGTTIGNGIITDDTTQLAADYISRFKIITIGASLSKTVSYLNKNFWNHKHKLSEGHQPVDHADLDNLVSPGWDATLNTLYPSGIKSFRKSAWKNDDHPQYLHRAGSVNSFVGGERDRHDNCVFRMLGVKSPFTTDFQGRANLSVTDDGTTAHLNTSEFTTLILGGTAWPVELNNVQVNTRLYFTDAVSPVSTLSDDYIQYTDSANQFGFISDGSLASSTVAAGTVRGLAVIGDATVSSVTDMTVGGDSSSSSRIGAYKYLQNRYQYVNIQPAQLVLSAQNISDGLVFDFGSGGLINTSTVNTSTVYIPVLFPNGAQISASESFRIWCSGNGTSGIVFTLIGEIKPAANNWVTTTASTLCSTFTATTSANNQITTAPYTATHTIDNSYAGRWYILSATFPVKISTNTPILWGLTFQYRMPQVDN